MKNRTKARGYNIFFIFIKTNMGITVDWDENTGNKKLAKCNEVEGWISALKSRKIPVNLTGI